MQNVIKVLRDILARRQRVDFDHLAACRLATERDQPWHGRGAAPTATNRPTSSATLGWRFLIFAVLTVIAVGGLVTPYWLEVFANLAAMDDSAGTGIPQWVPWPRTVGETDAVDLAITATAAIANNSADDADVLGFAVQGRGYFLGRPTAWAQFQVSHPDLQIPGFGGDEYPVSTEVQNEANQARQRQCDGIKHQREVGTAAAVQQRAKDLDLCDKPVKTRVECQASVPYAWALKIAKLESEWRARIDGTSVCSGPNHN